MTEAEREAHDKAINIIVVTQAFADGKKIKSRYKTSREWYVTAAPAWDWSDTDYEIMGEEPKELTPYERAVEKYGEEFDVVAVEAGEHYYMCTTTATLLSKAADRVNFAGYVYLRKEEPYRYATPTIVRLQKVLRPIAVLFNK